MKSHPLDKVGKAMAWLRVEKAAGMCRISAEQLRAGDEAMLQELHVFLTAVWHSGTIPPE